VDNKKYAYIFIYSLNGNAGACTAGIYHTPSGTPTFGQPLSLNNSSGDQVQPSNSK
jgi:hypothetical protein